MTAKRARDQLPATSGSSTQNSQQHFRSHSVATATLWMVLGASSASLHMGMAHAQSAPNPQTATHHLNIPAGTLDQSLSQLGQQTGIQISVNAELTQGLQTQGLHDKYSIEQALAKLLQGTELAAVQNTSGGYSLQKISQQSLAEVTVTAKRAITNNNASELPEVTITANAWDGTTEGTDSYTQTGPTSTATGLDLTLRETPQSITVITRQKMDDFNQRTLTDVITATPGITVERQGDNIRFFARGAEVDNFQTDGGRGAGHRSNGAPVLVNYTSNDMSAIDRVEVLKGSAGLLQGDGSPTATINLIRKKPTRDFQTSMTASAGSWDNYRSDIDVSGPITESGNIRARTVMAYGSAGSYRDNVKNRSTLLYGTLDVDLTANTLLNVGLDYKRKENQGNAGWMGARAYDPAGNFYGWTSRSWNPGAPWSGYKNSSTTAFGSIEHAFANGWQAKLRLSHEDSSTPDWFSGNVNYPGANSDTGRYKDTENRTSNINLSLKGSFNLLGRNHDLVVGADLMRHKYQMDSYRASQAYLNGDRLTHKEFISDIDNYLNFGGNTIPMPDDNWDIQYQYRNKTSREGINATTRLNLHDKFKIILGTRISNYEYQNKLTNVYQGANSISQDQIIKESHVLTPYAGFIYDLHSSASIYASYASIFQPVTVQDEQGRTLDPEEGVTYEIGSKIQSNDDRFNLSFAHFWKRWENTYEASGGKTPTGGTAYRSINGAMSRGYELEVSGEPISALQLQGSYVMNVNTLSSASTRPKHQFKINGSYTLPKQLEKLTLGAGLRWQSKTSSSINAPLEQPGYWLTDVMLRYQVDRNLTATLNVNNIFDKKYIAIGVPYWGAGEFYTWGEPRSINLALRYQF